MNIVENVKHYGEEYAHEPPEYWLHEIKNRGVPIGIFYGGLDEQVSPLDV